MRFDPAALLARLAGVPRWLVGLLIVLVFVAEPLTGRHHDRLFAKLEAIAYDKRRAATEPGTGDPQVVIVDIDEGSLAKEGRWPWSRDKMAKLVTQLLDRQQARAVGFDVLFAERDTSGGVRILEELARGPLAATPGYLDSLPTLKAELDFDARFAAALAGRPVILAYSFTPNDEAVGLLPPPAFTQADLGDRRIVVDAQPGYLANLPLLQRAAAGAGHIDPIFDSDNVIRRVPLLKRYGDGYYPALAVALARLAVDAKKIAPKFDANGDLEALDLGGLVVPVAADATAQIPYRGPQRTFRYIPASEVLAGTRPADDFAGAIVLIGTTAKGLQDLRSTPVGPEFPGVEIHANLLSGMLNGDLKSVPGGALETEALAMFVAGLLAVFALPWKRPVVSFVGLFVIAAAVIGVNLWFWVKLNAVIPLATTLVMLLGLLVWNLLTGFARESRAIRELSEMFGEYVPRERVAAMRESGQRFSMEGESRELSVLFSDVRGFTSVSESLPPRQLSAMMNAYLTPLTAVIHDRRGTIDKYIGDAIMAFWGAPLPNLQHARDAVHAALAMQAKMKPLGEEFRARGWPALEIGVGVNTGTMNVGDMGSRFRKAYTVLGDAVNLASRIEGLTRIYGVGILIGEDTRRAVPEIVCREVDRVRVKGRHRPVTLYEPLGETVAADRLAEVARWHDGLALYRQRRFADARRAFAALAATHPDDRLYGLFVERCDAYEHALLPGDWDGAANYTSK